MLYPNSHTPHLQKELFESPTSEYRSTPFWAWNGKLNPERLSEQIHFFKKMGFGGFHMHVRTGMDSPYLTEESMGATASMRQRTTKCWPGSTTRTAGHPEPPVGA